MIQPGLNPTEMRRFVGINVSGETIPSHGIVRVTSIDEDGYWEFDKPNGDFSPTTIYAINGDSPIEDEGYGTVTRDFPALALHEDADGTPAVGQLWGPKEDSWKLHKGRPWFLVTGMPGDWPIVIPVERELVWVKIDSPATTTADRYAAKRFEYDANARAWTEREACWLDPVNGENLTGQESKYWPSKLIGAREADGLAIYAVQPTGSSGASTTKYFDFRCEGGNLNKYLVTEGSGTIHEQLVGAVACCDDACADDPPPEPCESPCLIDGLEEPPDTICINYPDGQTLTLYYQEYDEFVYDSQVGCFTGPYHHYAGDGSVLSAGYLLPQIAICGCVDGDCSHFTAVWIPLDPSNPFSQPVYGWIVLDAPLFGAHTFSNSDNSGIVDSVDVVITAGTCATDGSGGGGCSDPIEAEWLQENCETTEAPCDMTVEATGTGEFSDIPAAFGISYHTSGTFEGLWVSEDLGILGSPCFFVLSDSGQSPSIDIVDSSGSSLLTVTQSTGGMTCDVAIRIEIDLSGSLSGGGSGTFSVVIQG